MAVYLDDSSFFKFVIVSDNPRPSKNNFTEKPPKDKEPRDIMSTSSSSPPPNNEKLDEKNQNSQEVNKPPEVKVFDTPNSNGDSTKEQKNEEKSSGLTIEVPTKSSSPQLVASPREIKSKTPEPAISPIPSPQNSIFKKIGNMIRSTSDSGTNPDQEETATSDSKDQIQQEQPKDQIQQEQPKDQVQQEQPKDQVQQEQPKDKVQQEQPKDQVQQEQQVVDNTVANDKITENTVNSPGSIDENKKEGEDKKITPEPTPAKRTGSLSNLVNMKSFITRTSSLVVEKLQEKFDSLDRKIYPDMDPEYPDLVEEEQNKSSREAAISEREQLLGNKDVETTNGTSQIPQSTQSTQNVMAEVGVALNERKEKLDKIGERTEELSNNASNFAELAAQIRKEQEKKSKSWFW